MLAGLAELERQRVAIRDQGPVGGRTGRGISESNGVVSRFFCAILCFLRSANESSADLRKGVGSRSQRDTGEMGWECWVSGGPRLVARAFAGTNRQSRQRAYELCLTLVKVTSIPIQTSNVSVAIGITHAGSSR